jgi:hypothetical protein
MCLYLFFIAHVSFEGKTRERDSQTVWSIYFFGWMDGWMDVANF